MRDRDFINRLIDRAKAANCSALQLTLDLQILGQRHKDIRTASRPCQTHHRQPHQPWPPSRAGAWACWAPSAQLRQHRGPCQGVGDLSSLSSWTAEQFDPQLNWGDVEVDQKRWGGKLISKGIMDAEDARLAVNSGADALIVSNHGGPPARWGAFLHCCIASHCRSGGQNIEVWMDGGIRSGQDVLKARALGAQGTLIGRSFLYGLGAYGEAGVTRALQIIQKGAGHHHGFLRPYQHQQRGPLCAVAGHHPHAVTPLVNKAPQMRALCLTGRALARFQEAAFQMM